MGGEQEGSGYREGRKAQTFAAHECIDCKAGEVMIETMLLHIFDFTGGVHLPLLTIACVPP